MTARRRRIRRVAAFAVAAGTIAAGCTGGGVHRWHPNWYSLDQDIRLGQRLARQIDDEVVLLRHATLMRLLDATGERLLLDPPRAAFRNFPYSFKAVDSPEINAFALPGGPIYVNTGLVTLLDTEDQLAAVIAHEMSHVAARHATEMLTTINASNFLLLLALSVVRVPIPPAGLEGARLAYVLSVLRYSRGKESEADALGVELMWRAGYDPHQMAAVFRRFEEERRAEPTLLERLFSSHPMSSDRVDDVEARAARLGPPPAPPQHPATVVYGQVRAMFAKD